MGGGVGLVGRDIELSALGDALDRVRLGHGATIVIEGEPGLGKSELLEELARRLPRGVGCVRGRADPLENHRPFGLLRVALGLAGQATDPRRRAVAELLAGSAPSGSGPVQLGHVNDAGFRAVEAVVDLVQELAEKPIVVVLDDLQWADESTLLALRQLSRRTAYVPLLLVLASQLAEPGSVLAQLRDGVVADGATHMRLAALSDEEARELVVTTLGASIGRTLEPAVRGAAGNPLYLAELCRSLRDELAVTLVDGHAELSAAGLPIGFVETVRRRIDSLAPGVSEVLRAAAVAGTDFAPEHVAAVLGRTAGDVVGDLQLALGGSLLASRGDRLAFHHDLVRLAVYDSIPPAIRRTRHRAYADALIAEGAAGEVVAWHMVASVDPPDREVAEWLRDAALRESTRAPGVAAELLRRSLDYLDHDDPGRDLVRIELASELVWAGRTAEGAEVARDLLAEGCTSSGLLSTLALADLLEGRYADAVSHTEQAATSEGVDELTAAQLHAEAALARFLGGDMSGAQSDGAAALEAGRRLGDELSTCVGLCALAWTHNAAGDGAEAMQLALEAVRRSEAATTQALARYSPHLFLGVVELVQDQLEKGTATLRHGLAIAEAAGTLINVPSFHACLALAHVEAGDWDDSIAECEAGVLAADDLALDVGRVWLHAVRAYVAVQRDDLTTATAELSAGEAALLRSGPGSGLDWLMLARGLATEVTDPVLAHTVLSNAWGMYEALGIRTHRAIIGPELVRVGLAAGDRSLARSIAASMAAATDARTQRLGAHGLALVDTDPDALLQAVARLRARPRPFETARACADAGATLAATQRIDEAKEVFDEAADIFARLGAARPLARLQAAQREAGITRGTRGARNRPSHGWESLTTSEQAVVRLVAEGLSNRQIGERMFVSRRTVETHVSHVFTKLGVTSRMELARAVLARN